ncbi:MAG: hypothetical protein A2528_01260 [Candidatus Staskawiczbacteria bacterium RIFOXYD2_FULL_37_9]|uniref:Uncharacterized protein n=1 Tax=Candidatus Staskawiczbacteria bacterium RIFOXYB1_FULL_37_44 TaxID=1802223 RepID=A0A1G2IWZ4_9BACT|nr:MAG: hypothetical protein A2358_03935 [Candidatus Staskawiczbacteria bacterium RIFOXYB1_FULL_37_44]OGZ83783.1 MAG: hypothetical protein A2416_00170 [Candidatus Staskawiczbacteria bacterium RIFOXYC1_FULL_37_52]OGZ88932.1 MAG: hypothetical protein A2581_01660 [Candidatus Staskawiczbacteria bacterium RIFOXYD1_FULL_37_110]OGZ89575.1 MAG: hypothetical protein A2444_01405 [Candidatus Staskawiczbacteria bacterium RIFOXYC2_FULL_37_19]OGZ94209.1 MAG: hypothetical protein A2528_01260 [Candidatus Stask
MNREIYVIIVEVFSFLVVGLTVAFVIGWYLSRRAEIKRYRRILLSKRDVESSYNLIKKDINSALKNISGDTLSEGRINEIKHLLMRVDENIEKMNKYVAQGIKIIGKYDIIKKIDKSLKID